ncbi:hypothetical protein Ciccas_005050 [Cichlidogyrus casuarinus]|uniref:Uncharacterized protein n=1 Tax=Cichlidogyrus casuarinus TaxID=1844966 RepID=A0ABD2Q9R6_9PLAT
MVGVGDSLGKNSTLPRSFTNGHTFDHLDGFSNSSVLNESSMHSVSMVQPQQLLSFFMDIPGRKYAPKAHARQQILGEYRIPCLNSSLAGNEPEESPVLKVNLPTVMQAPTHDLPLLGSLSGKSSSAR